MIAVQNYMNGMLINRPQTEYPPTITVKKQKNNWVYLCV